MAHAITATWLGDPTPGRNGRLTLNPIPHLQPVLTAVILPVVMFLTTSGMMILATTPINPAYFKNPLRDRAIVSVAGPIANILCALVMLGVLWIPNGVQRGSISSVALQWGIFMNFILAAFNMLPLPPLDGYWIARTALPLELRRHTDQFAASQFSFLIVIVVGSKVMEYLDVPILEFVRTLLPR
jgi:Zn-dependent protease